MQAKPTQEELDQALQKCRTHYVAGSGLNPNTGAHAARSACYLPGYLKARHEYHKLLVAAGMLAPNLAEPDPCREDPPIMLDVLYSDQEPGFYPR